MLLFFVLSCNKIDKPKKPDNLISKNEMVNILTDMSLITAAKSVQKKVLEAKQINLEEYVFEKYNIDSIQFAESNNYYAYDLKTYEDIYARVNKRLDIKKQEFLELERIEKEKRDSIRNAKKKQRDSIKNTNIKKEIKPLNLSKKENKSQ